MKEVNEVAASRVAWTGQLSMDVEKAAASDNGRDSKKKKTSIVRLFLSCIVAGGIQYGWALQLSLLSPYSQARTPSCLFLLFVPKCFVVCVTAHASSLLFDVSKLSRDDTVCLMDLLIFPDSRALAHLGFPDVDLRSYCRIRGKFLFCFSQITLFCKVLSIPLIR
jgi:hypothetical protein